MRERIAHHVIRTFVFNFCSNPIKRKVKILHPVLKKSKAVERGKPPFERDHT
jgi:hypothetical protein